MVRQDPSVHTEIEFDILYAVSLSKLDRGNVCSKGGGIWGVVGRDFLFWKKKRKNKQLTHLSSSLYIHFTVKLNIFLKFFFFIPKACYILLKIKVISIYMKLKNGLKYVQMATYIWEHMRRQHKIGEKLSIEKEKVMSKTWNIHEDISTRVRKIINERRI